MDFIEARKTHSILDKKYPDHAVMCLLKGMLIYKENYPLTYLSPERADYEKELKKCINKYNSSNQEYGAENLLINLCARGLLLMFYADNNMRADVIPLAANTYWYIRQAFIYSGTYPDFYFFTGLYNYYREAYPEVHPVYQTLAFLFPKGDRRKGLQELEAASNNSIFLRAETCYFLLSIWESFENNYSRVSQLTDTLHMVFPKNVQYQALYIKNLLLLKRYNEAEKEILSNKLIKNPYLRSQVTVFQAILEEKKYYNYFQAEKLYNKGIEEMKKYGEFGNEYIAYAYYGLSRVCHNNQQVQKKYRKIADNLTDYRNVNFD